MSDTERVEGEIVTEGTVTTTELKSLDFRLLNPTEGNFLRRIDWNKEELLAAVTARVELYKNLVYSEDNMKQAKADRAELNALVKRLEEGRKRVKTAINEPYAIFESELKEVTQVVKDVAGPIDEQIKAFENQQKEEKFEKLKAVYAENIGNLAEVLPFEKIFDNRYLNATFSLQKASNEIIESIEKVRSDLETIDSLESEFILQIKDKYFQSLDLSQAMAENKRLKELKEKLEAEKRAKEEAEKRRLEEEAAERARQEEEAARREAERLEQEEKARIEAENAQVDNENAQSDNENAQTDNENEQIPTENAPDAPVDPESQPENVFDNKSEEKPVEKKYRATFWVEGSLEQIKALGDYMTKNNLKFGKAGK